MNLKKIGVDPLYPRHPPSINTYIDVKTALDEVKGL